MLEHDVSWNLRSPVYLSRPESDVGVNFLKKLRNQKYPRKKNLDTIADKIYIPTVT